jgi:predicted nucleotide-binding protein (sugar kinase/HSP70/actin superfamily)
MIFTASGMVEESISGMCLTNLPTFMELSPYNHVSSAQKFRASQPDHQVSSVHITQVYMVFHKLAHDWV